MRSKIRQQLVLDLSCSTRSQNKRSNVYVYSLQRETLHNNVIMRRLAE